LLLGATSGGISVLEVDDVRQSRVIVSLNRTDHLAGA
jgi:hypothetical protein